MKLAATSSGTECSAGARSMHTVSEWEISAGSWRTGTEPVEPMQGTPEMSHCQEWAQISGALVTDHAASLVQLIPLTGQTLAPVQRGYVRLMPFMKSAVTTGCVARASLHRPYRTAFNLHRHHADRSDPACLQAHEDEHGTARCDHERRR
jgi:hypothetical protein